MMTLFTTPKAFKGHIADIQHNAIASWARLGCVQRIVLLGDDPGVAGAAQAHGVEHIESIRRNEYGTPLINEMFGAMEDQRPAKVFCYVNADILLLSDFDQAIRRVWYEKRRFLMVGRRTDYDQVGRLSFAEDWEPALRSRIRAVMASSWLCVIRGPTIWLRG